MRILLAVVVVWLAATVGPSWAGSCKAAKLCCQGRDSGCVIQKASPNAIIESPRDKPCYCDHACLKLADCCDDFNETCTVTDCVLGEWSGWSECDNGCGPGRRTRSREVLRPERNGGKPCGSTRQTDSCQNYDACRRRARHFQIVETSHLAAGDAATSGSNFVTSGYCAAFTLLKVSRGCARRVESFREGSKVCVRCSSKVPCRHFKGIARWELTTQSRAPTNCHGKWLATAAADSWTSCDECDDAPARFAFV